MEQYGYKTYCSNCHTWNIINNCICKVYFIQAAGNKYLPPDGFYNGKHKKKENILKEKDTRLKTALAGISHDIRTPLTSLKGFFELLENEDNIEKRGKYIQIINKKIIELTELLEELFTYTKLQNEEYILELKEYDYKNCTWDIIFVL